MKVYLAGPFQMQAELCFVRQKLQRRGIEVTSRWLDVRVKDHNDLKDKDKTKWACQDLADVDAADYLIAFNPERWHQRGTGGRHVELGYAIARSKPIIYVGESQENLFHWHPNIKAWILGVYYDCDGLIIDTLNHLEKLRMGGSEVSER